MRWGHLTGRLDALALGELSPADARAAHVHLRQRPGKMPRRRRGRPGGGLSKEPDEPEERGGLPDDPGLPAALVQIRRAKSHSANLHGDSGRGRAREL